jgi:hypothetical protein
MISLKMFDKVAMEISALQSFQSAGMGCNLDKSTIDDSIYIGIITDCRQKLLLQHQRTCLT